MTGVGVLGMGVTLKPAHALGEPSGLGPAILPSRLFWALPHPGPAGLLACGGGVSHLREGASCAGGPCVSRQGCQVSPGAALKLHKAVNPSWFQEKAEAVGRASLLF